MNRLVARVRDWWGRRRARGASGLLGEPGSTQRPGPSSGGPGEGPAAGGSPGPKGPAGGDQTGSRG
ncbi:hypothetical protein ACFQW6_17150 [Nocardioides sp. GCM10028917]|uniref:hypothetical protein n=1 Tax=Nocardioides sp. GCM10028917 TaxID=3273408 RepID=UPI00361D6786